MPSSTSFSTVVGDYCQTYVCGHHHKLTREYFDQNCGIILRHADEIWDFNILQNFHGDNVPAKVEWLEPGRQELLNTD
jgi:hypothetical protein